MKSYVVQIHTDKYSGNFHRQLGVHISHIPHPYNIYECADQLDDSMKLFEDSLEWINTDHGEECCYIIPTPGRDNDGMGNHRDCNGEAKYPAYESVEMSFDKPFTEEMIGLIIKRAVEFCKLEKIKIKNIMFLIRTTAIHEIGIHSHTPPN